MSPLQIAGLAVAYLLAFGRLFDAARWAWAWLPPKVQPFLPAIAAAVPLAVDAFTNVQTKEQLYTGIIAAVGAVATSLRGAMPAAQFEKLSEEEKDVVRKARGVPMKTGSIPPASRSGERGFVALKLLLVVSLLVPALPACSSSQTPQAQAANARAQARAVYAASVVTLTALGDAHAAWVRSVAEPTAKDLDAFKKTLGVLESAARVLGEAKPFIEEGASGSELKEKLLEGLDLALMAANEMARYGGKVPKELLDVLEAGRILIGGAS